MQSSLQICSAHWSFALGKRLIAPRVVYEQRQKFTNKTHTHLLPEHLLSITTLILSQAGDNRTLIY